MVKVLKILISTLMVVSILTSNIHFLLYSNTCNTSNKYEITLEKHLCSSDCCGASCILSKVEIESCCSSQSIFNIEQALLMANCCETNTISIDNSIDLQIVFNTSKIDAPVSYINKTFYKESITSKKKEMLIKGSTTDIPPPLSLSILEYLTKFNISNDDEDYYYYC